MSVLVFFLSIDPSYGNLQSAFCASSPLKIDFLSYERCVNKNFLCMAAKGLSGPRDSRRGTRANDPRSAQTRSDSGHQRGGNASSRGSRGRASYPRGKAEPSTSADREDKASWSKSMDGFDPKRMDKGVKFLGSFDASPPPTKLPEVAFVGRSNVGKSSLLNSLTGQKIAVTSKTPGRTQRINIFAVKDEKNSEVTQPPPVPSTRCQLYSRRFHGQMLTA